VEEMLTLCKQKHISFLKLLKTDDASLIIAFGMWIGGELERVSRIQLMRRLKIFILFNFLSFILKMKGEIEGRNELLGVLII
jgi:hypothetical protein